MLQKAPEQETDQLQFPDVKFQQERETKLCSDTEHRGWLSGSKGLLLGIVLGISLSLVTGKLLGASRSKPSSQSNPSVVTNQASAQTVTVETVASTQVSRTLEATGTVAAVELIPVMSQATGLQIRDILVDEGDLVQEGQLLARLDDSTLQARLAQAKASIAESEAILAELKAGARLEERRQAKARLAQVEARLREAQASIPRRIQQATAQVQAAQAQFELAKSRYQSYQNLVTTGAVAQDQFNQILSQYNSAKANLLEAQERLNQAKNTNTPEIEQLQAAVTEASEQLAQLQAGNRPEVIAQATARLAQRKADLQLVSAQLKDTRVVAPRSGIIAVRKAKIGDITSSSEQLFQIIENGSLELLLKVPETQLNKIKITQTVKITSDADSSLSLVGKVKEIAPIVDEDSRQATVKVSLPKTDFLRPGMFVRGVIITAADRGLAIPTKAVLPQADGSTIIYRLGENNLVEARIVTTGAILPGEKIEIKSGLGVDERVVVKGAAYLKNGDRVSVVNSN